MTFGYPSHAQKLQNILRKSQKYFCLRATLPLCLKAKSYPVPRVQTENITVSAVLVEHYTNVPVRNAVMTVIAQCVMIRTFPSN